MNPREILPPCRLPRGWAPRVGGLRAAAWWELGEAAGGAAPGASGHPRRLSEERPGGASALGWDVALVSGEKTAEK